MVSIFQHEVKQFIGLFRISCRSYGAYEPIKIWLIQLENDSYLLLSLTRMQIPLNRDFTFVLIIGFPMHRKVNVFIVPQPLIYHQQYSCCIIDVPLIYHQQYSSTATHSSVLAWRIPGTGKPGGLPSMGSHRVGHD